MLPTKELGRKFRLLGSTHENIEDKLSDKLHDELTKALLIKKLVFSRSLKQDLVSIQRLMMIIKFILMVN